MREGGKLTKVYFLLTTEGRPAGSEKYFADISSEFTDPTSINESPLAYNINAYTSIFKVGFAFS